MLPGFKHPHLFGSVFCFVLLAYLTERSVIIMYKVKVIPIHPYPVSEKIDTFFRKEKSVRAMSEMFYRSSNKFGLSHAEYIIYSSL